MARISIELFGPSLQKAEFWLRDLMRELEWDNPKESYQAMRAVLQTLRDRLPLEVAIHLGSQMPLLIRGFYLENWDIPRVMEKVRTQDEFFDFVLLRAKDAPWIFNVEIVVRAVLKVLCRHVSAGEIADIINILPQKIKELWPIDFQYLANEITFDRARRASHRHAVGIFKRIGPKNYKRPDRLISDEIFNFLTWDDRIDATEIDFSVKDGIVKLYGTVDTGRTRRLIDEMVENILGVTEIYNELKVMQVPERSTNPL